MKKRAEILMICIITLVLSGTGCLFAAENRTPTPEEIKEVIRQYNQSGKLPAVQRTRQMPRGAEQFNRALSLHTKKGATAAELKEAAALYQEASDAGVAPAATNLALLYMEGKGVKKNVAKALALLTKASGMNDPQADITLARLYLIGTDVKKDEKKGETLLNKAAKTGNQNAVKMLAEYKEWKKKNEIAAKQYQELMKKVPFGQNKPVVPLPPALSPLSAKPAELSFPVIPGYSFLMTDQVFVPVQPAQQPTQQPQSQSQPINLLPVGGTVFQPFKAGS